MSAAWVSLQGSPLLMDHTSPVQTRRGVQNPTSGHLWGCGHCPDDPFIKPRYPVCHPGHTPGPHRIGYCTWGSTPTPNAPGYQPCGPRSERWSTHSLPPIIWKRSLAPWHVCDAARLTISCAARTARAVNLGGGWPPAAALSPTPCRALLPRASWVVDPAGALIEPRLENGEAAKGDEALGL